MMIWLLFVQLLQLDISLYEVQLHHNQVEVVNDLEQSKQTLAAKQTFTDQ